MSNGIQLNVARLIPSKLDYDVIHVKDFTLSTLQDFDKSMRKLIIDDDVQVIPVIINSYGGQVDSLLGMIDIIESCPKPVATIASGVAMSCGAVLLAAGTKGYRFAGPNAQIMIHQITTGEQGKMSDFEVGVAQSKKISKKLFDLLNKLSGKKAGFYEALIKKTNHADVYLEPKDALRHGLIDHVGIPLLT